METCDYYNYEMVALKSREIGQGRMPRSLSKRKREWCDHPKHSVRDRGSRAVGGLSCKGDLRNCNLGEKFYDVD